jgi:hypothetical protein
MSTLNERQSKETEDTRMRESLKVRRKYVAKVLLTTQDVDNEYRPDRFEACSAHHLYQGFTHFHLL